MSFAPLSARHSAGHHRRHHGILPLRALHAHHDWGEHALQRTWRTVSVICLVLSLGNAFVARLPAVLLLLASIWAHFKGNPTQGARLAAHPLIGAPWRWWMHRGRHHLPAQAPDTTPQI